MEFSISEIYHARLDFLKSISPPHTYTFPLVDSGKKGCGQRESGLPKIRILRKESGS